MNRRQGHRFLPGGSLLLFYCLFNVYPPWKAYTKIIKLSNVDLALLKQKEGMRSFNGIRKINILCKVLCGNLYEPVSTLCSTFLTTSSTMVEECLLNACPSYRHPLLLSLGYFGLDTYMSSYQLYVQLSLHHIIVNLGRSEMQEVW